MYDIAEISPELDECAREPIHVIGSIQPHGYLFVLNEAKLTVAAASKNASEALGVQPMDLIGQPIGDLLIPVSGGSLEAALKSSSAGMPCQVRFRKLGPSEAWDCIVQPSDGHLLLELTPRSELDIAESMLNTVHDAIDRIRKSDSVKSASEELVKAVRTLTGIDRVMVYEFSPDWDGEVIAEDKADRAQSYLGHCFPAGDIPEQARALYARNTIRLIPDATYAPSPIIPQFLPPNGRPIDLSHAILRSVSPIHIEYLANMGVAASLSVSIMQDGKLWGLVIGHHAAPYKLSFLILRGCELLAQALAWHLDIKERYNTAACIETMRQLEIELKSKTDGGQDYRARLDSIAPAILDFTGSNGFALCDGMSVWTTGLVPSDENILALTNWFTTAENGKFTANNLSEHFPPAKSYRAIASGVVARKLPAGWLIWFRKEWQHTLTWAGETAKKIRSGSYKGSINPRKSFLPWQQSVTGHSRPWTKRDQSAINEVQKVLLCAILSDQMLRSEKREPLYATMCKELLETNDMLQATNIELETVNTKLMAARASQERSAARANQAENLLTDALNCVSEAFVIWDKDGHLIHCNNAFKDLQPQSSQEYLGHGISFEEMLRYNVAIGKYKIEAGQEEQWISEHMRLFHLASGSANIALSDGRHIMITNRRMKSGGIAGLRIDITGLMQSSEVLKRALSQSQDVNQAKALFLANMSHELRTPLNAIIGFSQVIRDQKFGPVGVPAYAEYANDINDAGEHLLELITNVLDASRAEIGELDMKEEIVESVEIMYSAISLVRSQAGKKKIALELQPSKTPAMLRVDRLRLRQILTNLLTNAVKFTPEGGHIILSFEATPAGSVFAVSDNGIGMSPDEIEVAIEPFRQIDNALVKRHEGVGLGLSLVLKMTEAHGGKLEILSEKGLGTTVRVVLPPERSVSGPKTPNSTLPLVA
jgi:light-regulated signal transduction histidine kinase (bacteriophytochrome)